MAKNSRKAEVEISHYGLTLDRNDFFLPQAVDLVEKDKWFNLRPEYQRRLVWDNYKKSLFIESLLLNVPIPPVFLLEDELRRYEVMDGQQRLSTIVGFYNNDFILNGLERVKELNGKSFKNFSDILKRSLDRRRISATVIIAESIQDDKHKEDIRRLVFERLNSGGVQLTAHEIRNCVYSGPFNDLLIELAGDDLFDKLWEIPPYKTNYRNGKASRKLTESKLFRRMGDCEIVLRYFAFRNPEKLKGSVKRILDQCMREMQTAKPSHIENLKQNFVERLKVAHRIFGNKSFRVLSENGEWDLSRPMFDATMVAIDKLYGHRVALAKKSSQVQSQLTKLFSNRRTYETIIGRPNTARAIKARQHIIAGFLDKFI